MALETLVIAEGSEIFRSSHKSHVKPLRSFWTAGLNNGMQNIGGWHNFSEKPEMNRALKKLQRLLAP